MILSLLSTWSTKSSPRDYPTFDSVLTDSFFEPLQAAVAPSVHSRPYLKFSSATKESIAAVLCAAEERLRMDYRVLRAQEKDLKRRDILKNGGVRSVRKKEVLSGDSGVLKTNPVSVATSSATSSVPSSVASTPPPPTQLPPSTDASAPNQGRSALLGSISSFKKSRLRRVKTVDKSKPRI